MVKAVILVTTKPGEAKAVPKRLKRLKGVKRTYATLGRWDEVVVPEDMDLKQLGQLAFKVSSTNGVKATETLVGF
ncbi:MAG: Lrp/AsnC ligand binding domain-containing protein [Thermoproteota archaeon]